MRSCRARELGDRVGRTPLYHHLYEQEKVSRDRVKGENPHDRMGQPEVEDARQRHAAILTHSLLRSF